VLSCSGLRFVRRWSAVVCGGLRFSDLPKNRCYLGVVLIQLHLPLHSQSCRTPGQLTNQARAYKSRRTGGTSPPEFGVGDVNANCPPDFQEMPLRICQNAPFQAKNSFFSGDGLEGPNPLPRPFSGGPHSSPPTKPSGSASAPPLELQPGLRLRLSEVAAETIQTKPVENCDKSISPSHPVN